MIRLVKPYTKVNAPTNKITILELPLGAHFQLENGRVFQKGPQRRKRFECREKGTNRLYLFQPNAEVDYMKTK